MYRKINIKLLVTVFVVLLAVVVLVELADSRKGGRTFKQELVNVDADNVTSIEIYPKVTNGKLIKIYKENDEWIVESDGKKYRADQSSAGSMVSQLNGMKPESMAAADKDRWKQYEVTDSLGTRVKLMNGTDVLADIILGKFSYSQPRNMTSYVRLAVDKEVYGVNGMVGMAFNRTLDGFRDKTILKSTTADWTKLTFTYPADSSFTLEKVNEKWMIGDVAADSASVVKYFKSIAHLTDSKFAEAKPSSPATHQLKIEGNNMEAPVEISGYDLGERDFILESSQNPGNLFNSSDKAKKLFISKERLIP